MEHHSRAVGGGRLAALPINRVSCVSDEGPVGRAGPTDDLCASYGLRNRCWTVEQSQYATVVIKFRMIGPLFSMPVMADLGAKSSAT